MIIMLKNVSPLNILLSACFFDNQCTKGSCENADITVPTAGECNCFTGYVLNTRNPDMNECIKGSMFHYSKKIANQLELFRSKDLRLNLEYQNYSDSKYVYVIIRIILILQIKDLSNKL